MVSVIGSLNCCAIQTSSPILTVVGSGDVNFNTIEYGISGKVNLS